MTIEEFLDRLDVRHRNQNGWQARCPHHDDRSPSLSVRDGLDRILVKCFAGCTTEEVVKAMGLEMRDLFYDDGEVQIYSEAPEETYVYTDEDYQELYRKLRYPNKRIRYEGDTSARRVLYRLPELLDGIRAGRTVWYVEGEKDVETLRGLGEVATTAGGVNDFRPEFVKYFLDGNVVVVSDDDEPGYNHAIQVFESLKEVTLSVELAHTKEGKDITEMIEIRNDGGQFWQEGLYVDETYVRQ